MKINEWISTIIITLIVGCLFGINYYANKYILDAKNIYKVYINGKVLGYIEDDQALYDLVNKKQEEVKKQYNVDKVYPPNNFEIINTNSYDVELSTPEEIYKQISEIDSFTIKGYIVTVKKDKEEVVINILDKKIFDEAIIDFVTAFISEDEYNNYVNNTQKEIETTGKTIDLMYFDEDITIKKGYLNVKEKIYSEKIDLLQYLLFGENYQIQKYTVNSGDTIESISEANKLNVEEFLISNPQYRSVDSLLKVGDSVNITLINPVLNFSYDVTEVSDTKIPFEKKVVYDSSKSADYSEVTTPGVTGITRITQHYSVKNGETQQGVFVDDNKVVITEKVDQVTTVGKPTYSWGNTITGSYVDDGTYWGWPTNYPYILTSGFGYRWGTLHEGIDISGTGYNSPIYATFEGVVASAQWEGLCGHGGGYCVVLQHPNGYYTLYAHMAPGSFKVNVGDYVTRGQVIGGMGATGYATGTHLHFGVWKGYPKPGQGVLINPCTLWSGRC